jgi:hypothetical protein
MKSIEHLKGEGTLTFANIPHREVTLESPLVTMFLNALSLEITGFPTMIKINKK